MKATPVERKPNFDRWIEARIAKLSDVRRQKVKSFVEDMQIAKFSPWTVKSNIQAILTLGNDGKEYEKLIREDLTAWMRELDSNGYRPETISSYRRRCKRFLRWVHGCRTTKDPTPEQLKCIVVSKRRNELPEGILTLAEVQRILAASGSLRNRALIHVCFESGCRAGEVLGLRIKDIEFDKHGGVIVVSGKTGMRRLRLVESVHNLQNWLNVHPNRENPDAWVFPNLKGTPLTVESFNSILKATARKAGLIKRIFVHLLRHSRATFLSQILTEYQLRIYFGWTMNSDVPARYIHLSGRDTDAPLLKHYGLTEDNGRATCPRCGSKNEQGGLYCLRCGSVLDDKEALALEERKGKEEDVLAKFVKTCIEMDPNFVKRALKKSGAIEEIEKLKAGVS